MSKLKVSRLLILFWLFLLLSTLVDSSDIKKTEYSSTEYNLFENYYTIKETAYKEIEEPSSTDYIISEQYLLPWPKEKWVRTLKSIYVNNEELFPMTDNQTEINLKCFRERCGQSKITSGYGFIKANPTNLWIFARNKDYNRIFKIEILGKMGYNEEYPSFSYKEYGLFNNKREIKLSMSEYDGERILRQHYYKMIVRVPQGYNVIDFEPKENLYPPFDESKEVIWDFQDSPKLKFSVVYARPLLLVVKDLLEQDTFLTLMLLVVTFLTLIGTLIFSYTKIQDSFKELKKESFKPNKLKIAVSIIIFIILFYFVKPNLLDFLIIIVTSYSLSIVLHSLGKWLRSKF